MYPTAAGVRNIASTSMRYVPTVHSGKILVKYFESTCLGEVTNTDHEGEIKNQGDTVYIRTDPDITVSDHVKGQGLAFEHPESEALTMLIDKGKSWAFSTNFIDDKQTDIKNYAERWSSVAAKQLKIAIERGVFGSVYADAAAANVGNNAGALSGNILMGVTGTPVEITSGNVITKIVEAGQVLTEQNVPDEGRFMIVPPGFITRLLLSDLKNASITGDQTSVLRNGRWGRVRNFMIYESNLLTSVTDGGAQCWNILFGTKDAISFATQIVHNENNPNPFGFGTLFKGLQVYGFKVVKPEALGVLYAKMG
jgi:hypothetical protein